MNWETIYQEVKKKSREEPLLEKFFSNSILMRNSLEESLAHILGGKIGSPVLTSKSIKEVVLDTTLKNQNIIHALIEDLKANKARDPACKEYSTPLLFFKGFQALQGYRVAHSLWQENRRCLATFFQSRINEVFAVDIHPAAKVGCGIMLDHATSIVIGETAVVEDNVSLLQEVTLGGTGKEAGDRHPKVRKGVLIGAGAKILGNVEIGEGAKIGAGSVVLRSIPPHKTAAGVPAKIVGTTHFTNPAIEMNHSLS